MRISRVLPSDSRGFASALCTTPAKNGKSGPSCRPGKAHQQCVVNTNVVILSEHTGPTRTYRIRIPLHRPHCEKKAQAAGRAAALRVVGTVAHALHMSVVKRFWKCCDAPAGVCGAAERQNARQLRRRGLVRPSAALCRLRSGSGHVVCIALRPVFIECRHQKGRSRDDGSYQNALRR